MGNPFRRDEFIPRSEGRGCALWLVVAVGVLLTAAAGAAGLVGHLS